MHGVALNVPTVLLKTVRTYMTLPFVKPVKGVVEKPEEALVETSNPYSGVAEIPAIKFVALMVIGSTFEFVPYSADIALVKAVALITGMENPFTETLSKRQEPDAE
jgi:hypothetical protein